MHFDSNRIYELRWYKAVEGKLDELNRRFSTQTLPLFAKHDLEVVAFWEPVDESGAKTGELIYILSFPDQNAAAASWEAFRADADWQRALNDTEPDGVSMVEWVRSAFMEVAAYSPGR